MRGDKLSKEAEKKLTPELLGLSEDEFQIYTTALARRIVTAGEIGLYTKKEKVPQALTKLQEKGLLKSIPGKIEKYYGVPPLLVIQEGTKTFQDAISRINDELNTYLDQTLAQIDTEIVKSTETIVQTTDAHTQVLKDNIAQTDEQITNTMIENLDGIKEVSKNMKETLLDTFLSLQNDMNAMIRFIRKKINESCEEIDAEIKRQSSNSKEEIEKTLENEKARYNEFNIPFKDEITQRIRNCQEDVNGIELAIDKNIDDALTVSLDKLKTQISGLKKRFTKRMNKKFDQIKIIPITLGERGLANISTQKDEINENLRIFETKIQEEFSVYVEEYQVGLTDFITNVFDKINFILEQYKTSVDEIAAEYITNVNLSKQEVGTAVSTFESTIQKTLTDEMTKYQAELTKEKEEWITDLEGIVDVLHSNSSKVTENVAQYKTESLIKYEKGLAEITDTHENEIIKNVKDYRNGLTKLGTQMENIVTQFSDIFMKESTSLFQSVTNQMTNRFEEFKNIVIRADSTIKQTFDNLEENGRKFNRELEAKLFDKLSENRDILSNNSKIIQEGVDLLLDSHIENTKEVYEHIVEFNNSIVATHSESREEIKNKWMENLNKIINDSANERIDKLDKLHKYLVSGSNQLTTSFTNEVTSTLKEIETLRDVNIEEYTGASNEFKNAVSEHLKREVNVFERLFGDLTSNTTKTIKKEKETLDNLFTKLQTGLNNKVLTLQDLINNENSEAKKKIQELLEEESSEEKMIYEKYGSTFQERIDELMEKVSSYLDDISHKINDTLQVQIDEIEPELVRFKASIMQDSESRLRDLSEDVQDILTKISTDILNFTSSMNQIANFFTSNAKSLFEELQTTISNIERRFSTYIESHLTETKEYFEDYVKEVIETSENSKNQVTVDVKELREEISVLFEKVDTQETRIESLFQSISDVMQVQSEILLNESDELEHLLRDNLTIYLVERERLLQSFKEMLSKRFTKSKNAIATDVNNIRMELEIIRDDKWNEKKQKAYEKVLKLLDKCEGKFSKELTTDIIENQLDAPLKNGDATLEELPITFKNYFEGLKSKFDEKSQDTLQQVKVLGTELNNERHKIRGFKEHLNTNLDHYTNLIIQKFEQFKKDIQAFITPKITTTKDRLVEFKKSLATEISEKIIRSLTKASKNSELRIATTLMNFTNMLNNLAKGFADNLDLRFKEFSDEYQISFEELSQIVEAQLKKLKETTDSVEKYNKDLIEKQLEDNKAEIRNIENELIKYTEELHITKETSLKTLEETLLKTLDERTIKAIDIHQNIKESTEIACTETSEEIANELRTLNETIISAFQSEMGQLTNETKNLTNELNDVQATYQREYEELLATQINTITNMVEGIKSLLEKKVEDTKIASSEYVGTTKKLYTENIETVNKEITTAIISLYKNFLIETQSIQKEINQRFTDQISALKKEIIALKQENKKQIANAKRLHSRAINTLKKELSADFSNHIEYTESQIVATQTDISDSMLSHLFMYEFSNAFVTGKMAHLSEDTAPQLVKSMNDTNESFMKLLSTQEGDLDAFLQMIRQNWVKSIDSSKEIQTKSLELFEDALKKVVASNDTEIENIVAMIKENAVKLVDLHLTTSKESRATLREEINEQLSKVLQEVNAIALSKIEAIDDIKLQISKEIEKIIDTTRHDTEDIQTKHLQETKEKAQTIGDEIITTLNKISETFSETITATNEEIKKLIADYKLKIDETATLVNTEITNNLEQTTESFEKSLNKLNANIETIRGSRTQIFEEHVLSLDEFVINALDTNLEDLQRFLSGIQEFSQNWTSQITDGLTSSVQQLNEATKGHLETEYDEKMEDISKTINELGDELSTSQNIIDSTKNDLRNSLNNLLSQQAQNLDEFNKAIKTKFTGDIKANLEKLAEVDNKIVQETRNKIQETLENTRNYEIVVKDVWDEIQDILQAGIASDSTWYLFGEQLNEFIRMAIERTKHTLTLITPNIRDVPLDTIKKLDPLVRVLIITQPEIENEEEKRILQELNQLGNVRVRKNMEINYRILWRDNEEVLIAPKGMETLGIISEDPNYVAMIDKIIRPEVIRSVGASL